ncbi:MAG: universal stress protein UspA [Rhodocyclales bacterium GT-UBC]|nr:MAG: universal stress protein UspA [Rhodocyclales bacterium GT-UBC]
MYRHLLVPIDASPLASATIEQAVAFARTGGARLTFFHARPDYAATGDGALLHAMAPAEFDEAAAGNARALLAKAEAAARAAGVESDSLAATSDRPHEAILNAAAGLGCDLIFMASHGRRGLNRVFAGSITQKVLQETTLPVLVAAVENNLVASDEQRALSIIRGEHRSLAAVVHGLQHLLRQITESALAPDFALLRSMLFYIQAFPERQHHPKENLYLFARLRERTGECDALIDELERQHVEGAACFAELRAALAAWEAGTPGGGEHFARVFARFAESQWQHMGSEENLVLPAASRHLRAEDWAEIVHAFGSNGDPRFDAEASFEHLFARLMNLAAGLSPA